MFIAIFAIIWGAFGAGQASSYGPDVEKGKTAANKIFKITEIPSEIDTEKLSGCNSTPMPEAF